MTVWYHQPTIFKQCLALRTVGLVTLCVAFITTLLFADALRAAPGVNSTLSFQGRLLSASGAVVPDGYYNMQFKIYQDGSGTTAGNPDGTLEWTESHVNNGGTSGVKVQNGFFSVNLGSKTAFGTSVDWGQDTLWLSMNIAGSSASCTTFGTAPCTADGEMLPMKQINSVPQAMSAANAIRLGGIEASGFIQNTGSPQSASINIDGDSTANTVTGTTSVMSPMFDSTETGDLSIGTVNATSIDIATNNVDHDISIGTGTETQTVAIGSVSDSSSVSIKGGSLGISLVSANGITNTIAPTGTYSIGNGTQYMLTVGGNGTITMPSYTSLQVQGAATFSQGLSITGGTNYTTPGGATLSTRINVPNYVLNDYGTIIAMGITSASPSTARAIMVADQRSVAHQPTIAVLSPNENQVFGFSWEGSNSTAYLKNSANSIGIRTADTTDVATFSNTAISLLQPVTVTSTTTVATNNNNALLVRNNSSDALLRADTNNMQVVVGNGSNTVSLSGTGLVLSGTASNIVGGSELTVKTDDLTVKSASDTTLFSVNAETANGTSSVQVGSGAADSENTMLTLDKASSAPTVTDSSALLGSLYYDTTLGKVQCYEADGWGSCGDGPDTFVTISPEYAGAVLNGSGQGAMTSGICSDNLNINDGSSGQPTTCGTNETQNFYKWTSTQGSAQTYDVFVNYKLPDNFGSFVAGSTSLKGRTDSTYSTVAYQVYKNNGGTMTACGSSVSVSTGVQTTWQTGTASGTADPANCSFTAGNSLVFKITLSSQAYANAYTSDINFAFTN